MAVINCQHCKYPVAKDAAACPHCGSKSPQEPENPRNKYKEFLGKFWSEMLFWSAVILFCYFFATEGVHKIFG